jgi:glucans biosynthesis protein
MGLDEPFFGPKRKLIHISSFWKTSKGSSLTMDRRDVLKLGTGFAAALFLAREAMSASAAESLASLPKGESAPFSEDIVIERARQLSQAPYAPPENTIPAAYKDLNYDQYRAIRFRKDLALWKNDNSSFTAEFFSAGYIYLTPVQAKLRN